MTANNDNNLSGAYALNAVDAHEAKAFEAELATSDQLRYEVTELRDTAVLLGLAVEPVTPSAGLKASIMGLIESTPQVPADDEQHELAPVQPLREFERPAAATARARWFARPGVIVTSLAAAAALILGGVVVSTNVRDMGVQSEAFSQYTQITSAEDAVNVVADVTGGGTATVHWSHDLASAAVTVDGVTALPGSKTYEMWFIGTDGTARPAGMFNTDDTGNQWSVLDGEMQPGDTIGLTVEPAGGSTTPTTTPVVMVPTA